MQGTRTKLPPFSTLLAYSEKVKESWEKPRERAPIPHAELLTVAELTQKASIELAIASNRLSAAGIKGFSPEAIVQQIADNNGRSAQQIYNLMLAAAAGGGRGGGEGNEQGQGRGYGGGAGGGVGQKTLSQFCADENIPLKDALARLQAKGLQGSESLTLREIAVNNGYSRPYEILEIIRGR
jgi:hypothetical protein